MAFFDNQMLSNIQWTNQTPETLVWRFPDTDQVIQNGSTVILNPGQAFLFVNEGVPAGIITEPGHYDLSTASIPFISSMMAVFRGMDTKHKGKVFFINTTEIPNVKWGTKSPIKYADPVYKFPVGLRAFGNYSFQINDPGNFYKTFVGDRDEITLDDFKDNVTDRVIQPITDSLATARFAFTDVDSNRDELSKSISEKIATEFAAFGFVMKDFRIENTDFDEETQKRVGTVSDAQAQVAQANALAGMNEAGLDNLERLGRLKALENAAENPNGMAAAGVGLGAGVGMGSTMINSISQPIQPQPLPTQQAPVQAPTVEPQTPPVTPTIEPQQPSSPAQGE